MKTPRDLLEESELLVLPDGRILAHNITPEMAMVLSELDPENELMRERKVAQASRLLIRNAGETPCHF